MQKKKSLGQNFLKSKSVVETIISASDIMPEDVILEIGPGEGFMTEELLKWSDKVVAIEKDHRLIPVLQEKFKKEIENGKFDLLEKDVLDFDIKILKFYRHPYKIIANIPYYITGQIIRKFLESDYKPESMTLLVQKEVAERIIARDGKESLLSLSVKIFGKPKLIKKIPKGNFNPAPKVDSAVLLIENISSEKIDNISLFFDVIHAGFSHKRKQILPNLSNKFPKEKIIKTLEKIGIDPKSRAEDIDLETWIKLTNALVV